MPKHTRRAVLLAFLLMVGFVLTACRMPVGAPSLSSTTAPTTTARDENPVLSSTTAEPNPTATSRPTRTAAPSATVSQAATAAPSEPEAAEGGQEEEPWLIASSIRLVFESIFGFTFEEKAGFTAVGRPPDGHEAVLELVGDPDDLERVTLIVGLQPDMPDETFERSALMLVQLLVASFPQGPREQAVEWLSERAFLEVDETAITGGCAAQSHEFDDLRVIFEACYGGVPSVWVLSITPSEMMTSHWDDTNIWWYEAPGAQAEPGATAESSANDDDVGRSSGLGISRAEWEQLHGSGKKSGQFYSYEDGKYLVIFTEERVLSITRVWSEAPVDVEEARAEGLAFAPSDAVFMERYAENEQKSVEVYRSFWLQDRFEKVPWFGGFRGTFSLVFRGEGDEISRVTVTAQSRP